MGSINSLFCPKCGYEFPLFVRGTHTVRGAWLLTPWFRCPKCETLSRAEVNWRDALWAWPTALILLLVVIACGRSGAFGHGILRGILGGAAFGLIIGLGGRRGMRLVSLSGESMVQARADWRLRSLLVLLLLCMFFLAFAAVTRRWMYSLLALCVGLGASAFFHFVVHGRAKMKTDPEDK